MQSEYDVAIVGGGPAGSTTAALLRKYNPHLRVGVFEKERFPREHVGESQLPLIGYILNEMGCWDKVEAAGFPIKLGATYRWGASPDLWDFEFIPFREFRDEPRPARFEGQRLWTAFQVERSLYDKILLDHAAELGAEVFENCGVTSVERRDDEESAVAAITLSDDRRITARHYVDASGRPGVIRRGMGVGTTEPGNLRNVAFWDYWNNAEWAVTIGTGGTRVFVLSIGCGWIWFIPIRPSRVSIGFVCPKDYYQRSGMSPTEIYHWALKQEPLVQKHIANATPEGDVRGTKDWSFLADRIVGDNWYLAGESAGFADPILAGGLMLTHAGARELAYMILSLERGEHSPRWLREWYEQTQRRRIMQHINFADFWYAGNGQFTDLEEKTREIARSAGIELDAKSAFQWLSNGGFLEDIPGRAGVGGLDVAATKEVTRIFTGSPGGVGWKLNDFNVFKLNLRHARKEHYPVLVDGRIIKSEGYRRGVKSLPLVGHNKVLVEHLQKHQAIADLVPALKRHYTRKGQPPDLVRINVQQALTTLEVLLIDGWVEGRLDPSKQRLNIRAGGEGSMIHVNRDVQNNFLSQSSVS
ncbi:MAG: hypothetical protein Kow0022_02790 [Phycisphaerales bacterium]